MGSFTTSSRLLLSSKVTYVFKTNQKSELEKSIRLQIYSYHVDVTGWKRQANPKTSNSYLQMRVGYILQREVFRLKTRPRSLLHVDRLSVGTFI
jgi:hypothetical protein